MLCILSDMPESELRLRQHRVTWRKLNDSIVVLDLDNSTYLSVNGTGALIWEALVHGSTVDELVKSVTNQFDVSTVVARSDITRFTDELRSRGFLT